MAQDLTATRVAELTREDLLRLCGSQSLARGGAYHKEDRVTDLEISDNGQDVTGWVRGSRGQRYAATIVMTRLPAVRGQGRTRVDTACTCPVGRNCKHVIAVVLAVREAAGVVEQIAAPRSAGWESMLSELVHADDDFGATPIAVLFSVNQPRGGPYRAPNAREYIDLRPLIPGARGGWIRTGVSWESFGGGYYGYGRVMLAEPVRNALTNLVDAHRRASPYSYGRMPDTIALGALGTQWFELLEAARAAGVVFITAASGEGSVTLATENGDFVIEVTRSDAGDYHLHPRIELPDGFDAHRLIGEPATGFYAIDDGDLLLGRFHHPLDPARTRLLDRGTVTVPDVDWPRFLLTALPALRRKARVFTHDPSVDLTLSDPPRITLDATFEEGHQVRLAWGFAYGPATAAVRVPLVPTGPDPMREPDREATLIELALSICMAHPGMWTQRQGHARLVSPVRLTGIDTARFAELVPALRRHPEVELQIEGEPAAYEKADEAPVITIATSQSDSGDNDWFDLHVSVTVAGQEVPLADLIGALASGAEHLILDSGTWFSLDVPELHRLRELLDEARQLLDRPTDPLRLAVVHAGLWDEFAQLGIVESQAAGWQEAVQALLDLDTHATATVPESLTATLRPYQADGFQWLSLLWDARLGGILADDMGLGKTLQLLAVAARAKERGDLGEPILVIAPTSVLATWASEAARFAPTLHPVILERTRAKARVPLDQAIDGADLVITSYAIARIDEAAFTSRRWSAVILDEAQFVKNHQAKTYTAIRKLKARSKFAITGTPLENSLMDLWSLLSIVAPGLHPRPQVFKDSWAKPIESGVDPQALPTLRRRIRPLMMRRTKEAVASDLPPKQEQTLAIDLHPRHRTVYDRHLQRERQRILGLIDDLDGNRIAVLRALTALRQLALDPSLLDQGYAGLATSAKLDVLAEHLSELASEGHRALVFSQFTSYLALAKTRLDAAGISYTYLDGSTRNRPAVVDGFRDGDATAFLISLKAGGFGLTLTEADYVYVLDPWWNPAAENQAIDRTHRIGQTKPVNVYRLVSSGTIEEKVVALQERKRQLFAKVVDDGDLLGQALTADDLRALLTV